MKGYGGEGKWEGALTRKKGGQYKRRGEGEGIKNIDIGNICQRHRESLFYICVVL